MFIKNDFSSIPNVSTIEKAELILYPITLTETPFWYNAEKDTNYTRPSNLLVYAVDKTWDENTLVDATGSWVSFETVFHEDLVTTFAYEREVTSALFDITDYVKNQQSGSISNLGLMIKSDYRYNYAESTGGSMTYWHSSEAEDVSLRPVVKVLYESGQELLLPIGNTSSNFNVSFVDGAINWNRQDNGFYTLSTVDGRIISQGRLVPGLNRINATVAQGVYLCTINGSFGAVSQTLKL